MVLCYLVDKVNTWKDIVLRYIVDPFLQLQTVNLHLSPVQLVAKSVQGLCIIIHLSYPFDGVIKSAFALF